MSLQSAFLLHYRPYRETSLLVELLTKNNGRISAIANGARRPKSPLKGLLQPFVPLLIETKGKGDLLTLTAVESNGLPLRLMGKSLASGFYLNEILMRAIHRHDPCELIFEAYQTIVQQIANDFSESAIREFEKKLLRELGYGFYLSQDKFGHQVKLKNHYRFHLYEGLEPIDSIETTHDFLGEHLIAIDAANYNTIEILRAAKRLMRIALFPLVGEKPLKSRELFL